MIIEYATPSPAAQLIWRPEEIKTAATATLGSSIIELRNGTVTWGEEGVPGSSSDDLIVNIPRGWPNILRLVMIGHSIQGPNEYQRDETVDVRLEGVYGVQ